MRVRQHVNPLSSRNLEVVPPPVWAELFARPDAPLVLDLGCGSGRFLLALGERDGERRRNYLGLEIRAPLAARADGWARQLALPHVRFLATNANVNAPAWLAFYPGPLELVSFLHPDPHWCVGGDGRCGARMQFCSLARSCWPPAAAALAGSGSTTSGASCSPRLRGR